MKKNFYKRLKRAMRSLRPFTLVQPGVGMILGTGLTGFAEQSRGMVIPYRALKGFPQPTVQGHKGYLKLNREQSLVILTGRFHYYEGWDMDDIVLPVFLLAELGVKTLIITNAAGGINPAYAPGDFVLIRDHINLLGDSPLRGSGGAESSYRQTENSRFVDMRDAYSSRLRNLVQKNRKRPLPAGVYAALPGPAFETPAEVRMLERLGADMVGMSTVPEVLAARYLGLEVLGISLITNKAVSASSDAKKQNKVQPLSHEENLQIGVQKAGDFDQLMRDVLSALGQSV